LSLSEAGERVPSVFVSVDLLLATLSRVECVARVLAAVTTAAACLALAVPCVARADDVPPTLALTVMLKVLTYDSAFAARGSGDFVVLVPYAPKEEADAKEAIEAAEAVEQKVIVGRPLRFTAVPLAELSSKAASASAILLHRRTSAAQAKSIAGAAGRLYTLALDSARVDESILLGVGSASGRPQVAINIRVAHEAGVEFAPTVLKIARTVQ